MNNSTGSPSLVNEDHVAKIITMCILQKALDTPSIWSKWILLAALDELHGKPAPKLDEEQLYSLQGIECMSKKDDSSDVSKNQNFEIEGKPSNSSAIKLSPSNGSATTSNVKNVLDKCLLKNFNTEANSIDCGSSTFIPVCSQTSTNFNGDENSIGENSTTIQLNNNNCENNKNYDIGLGKVTENYDKSTQTEMEISKVAYNPNKLVNGKEPIIDLMNEKVPAMLSQYTQTNILFTAEKEVQTLIPWKIIRLTGVDLKYQKMLQYEYRQTQNNSSVKLFHGRPLIEAKSKMQPAIIPLQQVLPNLELYIDPRKVNLSLESDDDHTYMEESLSSEEDVLSRLLASPVMELE